jgi:D-glycero-D-manno-heptose 1,7-bisphosphate phosphatase
MNDRGKRALFLDRDGVINVERGYVHRREDFQFQEGIFELCQAAQSLGYLLVVVTNQAGIARGYYTEADFLELTTWMRRQFAERQIRIADVYYCPYHPVDGIGAYKYDSPDRKPRPGMLYRARADLKLDLASSILIGDRSSDIEAARTAGVGSSILLWSGRAAMEVQSEECHVLRSLDDIRHRFFSPALGDESFDVRQPRAVGRPSSHGRRSGDTENFTRPVTARGS